MRAIVFIYALDEPLCRASVPTPWNAVGAAFKMSCHEGGRVDGVGDDKEFLLDSSGGGRGYALAVQSAVGSRLRLWERGRLARLF